MSWKIQICFNLVVHSIRLHISEKLVVPKVFLCFTLDHDSTLANLLRQYLWAHFSYRCTHIALVYRSKHIIVLWYDGRIWRYFWHTMSKASRNHLIGIRIWTLSSFIQDSRQICCEWAHIIFGSKSWAKIVAIVVCLATILLNKRYVRCCLLSRFVEIELHPLVSFVKLIKDSLLLAIAAICLRFTVDKILAFRDVLNWLIEPAIDLTKC